MNESTLPPAHLDLARLYYARTMQLLSIKHGRIVSIKTFDAECIAPSVLRMSIVTDADDRFYIDVDATRMLQLALADCGRAN